MIDDRFDAAYAQRNSLRGQSLSGGVHGAAERDDAFMDRDAYPAPVDAGLGPIERVLDVLLISSSTMSTPHRRVGLSQGVRQWLCLRVDGKCWAFSLGVFAVSRIFTAEGESIARS